MIVLTDINIQEIDRLVLCNNKVLQQLTQATFLYAPEKDTWKEESSVNMKVFIFSQRSLCRNTGPNHA